MTTTPSSQALINAPYCDFGLVPTEPLPRRELASLAYSVLSHNLNPAIGQFRLAVDKGDPVRIEASRTIGASYVASAVGDIAARMQEPDTDRLHAVITGLLQGILDRYAEDVYAPVPMQAMFAETAVVISEDVPC